MIKVRFLQSQDGYFVVADGAVYSRPFLDARHAVRWGCKAVHVEGGYVDRGSHRFGFRVVRRGV